MGDADDEESSNGSITDSQARKQNGQVGYPAQADGEGAYDTPRAGETCAGGQARWKGGTQGCQSRLEGGAWPAGYAQSQQDRRAHYQRGRERQSQRKARLHTQSGPCRKADCGAIGVGQDSRAGGGGGTRRDRQASGAFLHSALKLQR